MLFRSRAGALLAVTADERHSGALVEQRHHGAHAMLWQIEPSRYILADICFEMFHTVIIFPNTNIAKNPDTDIMSGVETK